MKVTDWKNIQISAKEFLAGIVFVVSMSGVYYKIYYEQSQDHSINDTFRTETKKEISDIHNDIKSLKEKHDAEIRSLQDADLRRQVTEEARSNSSYQPMKRVK